MASEYSWRDIVKIGEDFFDEQFPISGEFDGEQDDPYYRIDEFIYAVAEKHGVSPDDILTYRMDGISYPIDRFPSAIYDCGLYIDGVGF